MMNKKTNKRILLLVAFSVMLAVCLFSLTSCFGMGGPAVEGGDPNCEHEWTSIEEENVSGAEEAEINKVCGKCGGTTEFDNKYEPANGIMEMIAIPFGAILNFFYKLVKDYAIALLLFAVAMKIILFPFSIKQQRNSVKQASLRPKEAAIRKKYAGREDKATQQKMQQEIMDLYQKENFNPMGGCLPLLLQFPILFALFSVIRNPLRYTTGLSVDQIKKIGDTLINSGKVFDKGNLIDANTFSYGDLEIVKLLQKEENFKLIETIEGKLESVADLPNMKILGILDLSATPEMSFAADKLILLTIPVLTFVIVFLSMRLTKRLTYQPEQTADARKSGLIMDLMMPVMSTMFTFMYPAVLGLYWIFQNILGVVQQLVLKKMFPIPQFTEEDYKKAELELAGKNHKKKKSSGPAKRHPKSLHHIDDDDDVEMVEVKKPKAKENSMISPAPLKDEEKDGKEE